MNPVSLAGFLPTDGTHFTPILSPDATLRTQLITTQEPTNQPTTAACTFLSHPQPRAATPYERSHHRKAPLRL